MKETNQVLWKLFMEQNCSQKEFIRRLGYAKSNGAISRWLSGQDDLSLGKLEKLCAILNKELIINLIVK